MTILTQDIDILFSTQAASKLEDLTADHRNAVDKKFKKYSSLAELTSDRDVVKLNDDFFLLRVDLETRLIFSIEKNKLLITDISYKGGSESLVKKSKARDLIAETLHEPILSERVFKLLERQEDQIQKLTQLESEILYREMKYERLGFVFAIILTIVGIGISAFLLVFTEKSFTGLIVLFTSIIPISLRLLTRKKKGE